MAKAVAEDYLRRIPKAELHCHIAGTLRATTVAELAKKYGLPLPPAGGAALPVAQLRRVPRDPAALGAGAAHAGGFQPRGL